MISDKKLLSIQGGTGIPTTLINTVLKLVNFTLDFGKVVGSVIRRGKTKSYC